MTIDWRTFAPALLLLLPPIGLFHGKKVRFRPIARDWTDHWPLILNLGLHWIDLCRAALGGWFLVAALSVSPHAAGFARYSVLLTQGAVIITAVGLQTFCCKERDCANAPFLFVSGLLIGLYPPEIAGFPLLLAGAIAAGARLPSAFFPLLAVSLLGVGYLFNGQGAAITLASGFCAVLLPWLASLMFSRDLTVTYRARRLTKDSEGPLPPPR